MLMPLIEWCPQRGVVDPRLARFQRGTRADIEGVDWMDFPNGDARRTYTLSAPARLMAAIEEERSGNSHWTVYLDCGEIAPSFRTEVRAHFGCNAHACIVPRVVHEFDVDVVLFV